MFSFEMEIALDSLSFTVTFIFCASEFFTFTFSETIFVSIFSVAAVLSLARTTSDPSSAKLTSSVALMSLAQTDPMLINRNIAITINKT